jgi:hypothetical protein
MVFVADKPADVVSLWEEKHYTLLFVYFSAIVWNTQNSQDW